MFTKEHISNIEHFHKKFNKDFDKDNISQFVSNSEYLVFAYYKDEKDVEKDKALKKFIIDNTTVIDYPIGARNYTYVIKLLLGPLYNDREILLCMEEKANHLKWLQSFNTSMRSNQIDSIETKLEAPVTKYEVANDSPLQVELDRMRRDLQHQTFSSSVDEEYEAHHERISSDNNTVENLI